MSGSKKSEPIKEVHIEKAHIIQPIGLQVQGKAPSSKFKEEEEKRDEARTDSEAGKVEKLAPAGGSGMLSKASGFLKGIFGGSRFAGIARVFAPFLAVAGTMMSCLFSPVLVTFLGAGIFWMAKNNEWVKKNVLENEKVKMAYKVIRGVFRDVLSGVFGMVGNTLNGMISTWIDIANPFSKRNREKEFFIDAVGKGKYGLNEAITDFESNIGGSATEKEKAQFQQAAAKAKKREGLGGVGKIIEDIGESAMAFAKTGGNFGILMGDIGAKALEFSMNLWDTPKAKKMIAARWNHMFRLKQAGTAEGHIGTQWDH